MCSELPRASSVGFFTALYVLSRSLGFNCLDFMVLPHNGGFAAASQNGVCVTRECVIIIKKKKNVNNFYHFLNNNGFLMKAVESNICFARSFRRIHRYVAAPILGHVKI